MKTTFGFGLLAAVVSAGMLIAPAAAQPMSPAPMMAVDCTKAGDMMAQSTKMESPAMTGDVDKDFMAMAMMHEQGMMMLMQVEVQCGKDPKVKAAAAKRMQESQQRLEMFRNQGTSN